MVGAAEVKRVALFAGSALMLSFATTAMAQDYNNEGPPAPYAEGPPPGYAAAPYGAPPEEVIVRPPYYGGRSAIGAPYQDVAISRPVRFDDLDLRTAWGADRLRGRVRFAATSLCHQLDVMYPVSVNDSTGGQGDCYRNAVDEAMPQAEAAIHNARWNAPPPNYGNPNYGGE